MENGHFSQNSKEGTKGKLSKMADFLVELRKAKKIGREKFSKMADFLVELRKAKIIGNTSRLMA